MKMFTDRQTTDAMLIAISPEPFGRAIQIQEKNIFFVGGGGGGGVLRWLRGMNMRDSPSMFYTFIHDTLSRSLLQNCIVSRKYS